MENLAKIFGSKEKVQLIRLFLQNPSKQLDSKFILEKTKADTDNLKRELLALTSAEFIEKGKSVYFVETGKGKSKGRIKKEISIWKLNLNYPYLKSLEGLVMDYKAINKKLFVDRIKKYARIKYFLFGGRFAENSKTETDVFIVAELIQKNRLESEFNKISIELTLDINYTILDLEEFNYRYKMYDKFVHDILNANGQIMINNLR